MTPNRILDAKGPHYCLAHPEEYDGPRYTTIGGPVHSQHAMASSALDDVHFAGECDKADCSPADPCATAARYLLATGRVAGTRGYIPSPQGRPTGHIAPAATGDGAPVSLTGKPAPAEEAPERTGGNGTGSGRKRRKAPNGPTDPQMDLILRLVREVQELRGDDAPPALTEEAARELSPREASTAIDALMSIASDLRKQHREKEAARASAELKEKALYRDGQGRIYFTKRSGAGRLYALELVEEEGEEPELVYVRGAITRLAPEHELAEEEALEVAARYGRETGQCMVCGRTLTNPESKERGIGPICAENL